MSGRVQNFHSTWTYNLSETGLYGFGLTVEDGNGGKRAYAFTVMASGNDTNANNTNATTEEEILEEIESSRCRKRILRNLGRM